MQESNEPVYDGCPDCGRKVPGLTDLTDDEEVECPSCPWKGFVDELVVSANAIVSIMGVSPIQIGSWPFTPAECPGFDPGNVLAAYGGRRCVKCGVREPNDSDTRSPRHDAIKLQQHISERSRNAPSGLFELPAYPRHMLEKFAAIQRELPIGTVLDWFKSGPEDYVVVTGYELIPALYDRTRGNDNSNGAYFVLYMSRADGTLRYNGVTMSFEEASTYAEKRVGMLAELATAEGEL